MVGKKYIKMPTIITRKMNVANLFSYAVLSGLQGEMKEAGIYSRLFR